MEERTSELRLLGLPRLVRSTGAGYGALLALAVLTIGALVYALDRPAGSATGLPWPFAPTGRRLDAFGVLGGNLPSFAHAFAFSLANCLLLRRASIGIAAAGWCCTKWALLETAFECLQHPALGRPLAASLRQLVAGAGTPDTFESRVLGRVANYLVHGTFDPLDVLAALLGAGASFALAVWWLGRGAAVGARMPVERRAPGRSLS